MAVPSTQAALSSGAYGRRGRAEQHHCELCGAAGSGASETVNLWSVPSVAGELEVRSQWQVAHLLEPRGPRQVVVQVGDLLPV